ncbi:S-layer homology domain-containing protein [Paenibacillus tarimensis]|nr:S-layer homology domain-containing protein [Paenibacillus tarimensis]
MLSLAVAAAVLTVTITVPVSAAALQDIQGHWAGSAIEQWQQYGVINGHDGKFRPNNALTRAEFAVMLDNIMKYEETATNTFSDLETAKWYAPSILKLNAAGILKGTGGKALPTQHITRQEAAVMLTNTFQLEHNNVRTNAFTDQIEIAEWAKASVSSLVSSGALSGFPDGTFRPRAELTRAEAVTIINKLIQELISKPGDYSQHITGNLVVNTPDVLLKNMKIDGDLYVAQGVGSGEITLDDVEISGSVYVYGGGEHSVILNNVGVREALVVNKYDGKIRVLIAGSTSVAAVKLESGARLVTKDLTSSGIENVEISADVSANQKIVFDGNFNIVVNHSSQADITVNGTIKELVAKTSTNLNGNPEVEKLTVEQGATATINNRPIQSSNSNVPAVNNSEPVISTPPGNTSGVPVTSAPGNTNGSTPTNPPPSSQPDTPPANGGSVPAPPALTVDNVFAAIKQGYLGTNTDRGNVFSNLNLMTSLADYEGLIITWQTSNPLVVSETGTINRINWNDQFVTLKAVLSGSLTGEITFDLTVRALSTSSVEMTDFIDPYFSPDYPQAYVKNGDIWIRYMLNEPAELYMVVNAYSSHFESSVDSVLRGHTGKDGDVVFVSDWPYFKVEASETNKVHEFNTGVPLLDMKSRIDFVVRDASKNYTSSSVTSIAINKEVTGAYDTSTPYFEKAVINKALDSIYLYYSSEALDLTSVPSVSDYSLNVGEINKVTIHSDGEDWFSHSNYVILSVSGIPEEEKDNLSLSYTGTALQDTGDVKNRAPVFTAAPVYSIEEQITSVTVSSDRKTVRAEVNYGWFPGLTSTGVDDPTISVSVDGLDIIDSSYYYFYGIDGVSFTITYETPLPAGSIGIKLNTSDMVNWAMDPYPAELTFVNEARQIAEPGIPSATLDNGDIILTFAEGYEFNTYDGLAAGLTIKVGDAEYHLRGSVVQKAASNLNTLRIDLNDKYTLHVKDAVLRGIQEGQAVQIKYTKLYGNNKFQLADSAGALLPDFDYVNVTAN